MSSQDENKDKSLRHIAIIMDGNGRWARQRGMSRSAGHRRGVETVKQVVATAQEIKLAYLTLFSFSSENWSRPKPEVDELMRLMKSFLKREQEHLKKTNVKIKVIGAPLNQDTEIFNLIRGAEEMTSQNTGLHLTVAFNYGGRDEIVRATKRIIKQVQENKLNIDDIDETTFSSALDTVGLPDPDLLIRTSGEYRISNFLLYQLAYSEFIFMDCNWPEFDRNKFIEAIDQYYVRERRFGDVTAGSTG